jgi:hypothetical protein
MQRGAKRKSDLKTANGFPQTISAPAEGFEYAIRLPGNEAMLRREKPMADLK